MMIQMLVFLGLWAYVYCYSLVEKENSLVSSLELKRDFGVADDVADVLVWNESVIDSAQII